MKDPPRAPKGRVYEETLGRRTRKPRPASAIATVNSHRDTRLPPTARESRTTWRIDKPYLARHVFTHVSVLSESRALGKWSSTAGSRRMAGLFKIKCESPDGIATDNEEHSIGGARLHKH